MPSLTRKRSSAAKRAQEAAAASSSSALLPMYESDSEEETSSSSAAPPKRGTTPGWWGHISLAQSTLSGVHTWTRFYGFFCNIAVSSALSEPVWSVGRAFRDNSILLPHRMIGTRAQSRKEKNGYLGFIRSGF